MNNSPNTNEAVLRAQALIAAGRLTEAGEVVTRALTASPQNYHLLCLLSQIFHDLGRAADACGAARKAIAAEPERDWAHRLHSISLCDLREFYDARTAGREAVRIGPWDPVNWFALANAQRLLMDRKGARQSAEKMRELAPDLSFAYQMLALVALSEGKYKQAEEHCRRELQLNPLSYEGLNNLGVSLSKRWRKREAAEAFHAAAKLRPDRPLAKQNLVGAIGLSSLGIVQRLRLTALFGMIAVCIGGVSGRAWLGGVFLGAVLLLMGAAIIAQRFRLRRMPAEAQEFYRFDKRNERLAARRASLRALIIVAVPLLLFWLLVIWSRWDFLVERTVFWLTILPALLLVLLGVGSFIGYVQTGKQLALMGDSE